MLFLRTVILLAGLCAFQCARSQAVITLNGAYTGKNLYIQNPYDSDGKGFCAKKVLVNGKEVKCELNSTAFEIKLDSCGFKEWDSVEVKIFHADNCKPKVLDPYLSCYPKIRYTITEISAIGDSVLYWKAKEQGGKWRYSIEQFRWNKWVKLGDTVSKSGEGNAAYSFFIAKYLHGGENKFRVKYTDYRGQPYASKSVIVKKSEEKDYLAGAYSRDQKIQFKKETLFELFDKHGNILKRGIGSEIELIGLKKGGYFLNYENFTTEFLITK